ncbi:MAG: nucleotidyl transferase AbiEii/AbiGii toxin family protein [Alphaproteobacteria bacterium]|nr:MAG: nucleotidyl transferase AbiEii/AbiGii toxin family protein [Alphaproteobacteria bacterium]
MVCDISTLYLYEVARCVADRPLVLKGGSALILQGQDRTSDDLDFDATEPYSLDTRHAYDMRRAFRQAAEQLNERGVYIKILKIVKKKDTRTTRRELVTYDTSIGQRHLKTETSFRENRVVDPRECFIYEGVKVYVPHRLVTLKLNAARNRTKLRDAYDLLFLATTFSNHFDNDQKKGFIDFVDTFLNRGATYDLDCTGSSLIAPSRIPGGHPYATRDDLTKAFLNHMDEKLQECAISFMEGKTTTKPMPKTSKVIQLSNKPPSI